MLAGLGVGLMLALAGLSTTVAEGLDDQSQVLTAKQTKALASMRAASKT